MKKKKFYQTEVDRSRMFYYHRGFIIGCEIINQRRLIDLGDLIYQEFFLSKGG